MRTLMVIEAPGKIPALERIFEQLGYPCSIAATYGHFCDYDDALEPLGFDERLWEFGRKPDVRVIEHLQRRMREADLVLIATDPDQEGEVIARDVLDVARAVHLNALRVRFGSFDLEGVRAAIESASPMQDDHPPSRPGRVRRMVDRLIGATYSTRDTAVGRVSSALLGSLSRDPLVTGELNLALKATSGSAFTAAVPVTHKSLAAWQDRMEQIAEIAAVPVFVEGAAALPMNYADALVAVGRSSGFEIPIKRAADTLQELYEAGMVSYIRTTARTVSAHGAVVGTKLAQHHRANFDASLLPLHEGSINDAHEAVRPTAAAIRAVQLSTSSRALSIEDRALQAICRHYLRCGRIQDGEGPDLRAVPEWAQKLSWFRPSAKDPIILRAPPEPRNQVTWMPIDYALVKRMAADGIGRPSTWAGHAQKMIDRGLLSDQGELTERAAQWLARSPDLLTWPATSQRIEQDCASAVERGAQAAFNDAIGRATPVGGSQRLAEALKAMGQVARPDPSRFAQTMEAA